MARARALVPVLQERAQRCEDQRRVPEETIADFERAGLLRLCRPARYGGYEMGWDVLCDLADVLAAADGSQAWLQHIYADHTVLVATFPALRRTRSGARTTTPSPRLRSIRSAARRASTAASCSPAGTDFPAASTMPTG